MWFLDQIVSWFSSARDLFYDAYLEVRGWIWPFHYLSTPLYGLYTAFYYITINFGYFNSWVADTAVKLTTILSYSNISSYFSYYFDAAINAWEWVLYAWGNVTNIINSWWSSTQQTVLTWINNAVTFLLSLINNLSIWLGTLQTAWDNFKGMIPSISEIIIWFANWRAWILEEIIAWGGIPANLMQDLINSTLREWFPFYNELASLWNGIRDFFTDPEDWLYKAIDRIIERFW